MHDPLHDFRGLTLRERLRSWAVAPGRRWARWRLRSALTGSQARSFTVLASAFPASPMRDERSRAGAAYTRFVKVAHVRELHAPVGAPWRLAAALGPPSDAPDRWLDLEVARRRAAVAQPERAHDSVLYRQPVTTLDDHLARGLRVEALADLVEGFSPREEEDDALLEPEDLAFGPPVLRPPSFRDFYAFEGHVATMWRRRDAEVPEAWYRLPIFYFSNVSEIRGADEPVWAPRGSAELDYELEIAALVDTPAHDLDPGRAEEAIGGFTILNDWSARDLQRDETTVRLGPAKGKDFASTFGPWLVTPDELAPARRNGATGPELEMTAEVNGTLTSRGTWSSEIGRASCRERVGGGGG